VGLGEDSSVGAGEDSSMSGEERAQQGAQQQVQHASIALGITAAACHNVVWLAGCAVSKLTGSAGAW
jgi:hypothetical protein